MNSYAEIFVDRDINDGWKTFRARLANHVLSDDFTAPIDLVPAERDAGVLVLPDPDGLIAVSASVDNPGTAGTRRLRGLGFRRIDHGWQLTLDHRYADQAAHAAYAVLHELLGVIHPRLLDIDPVGLGLWDEPPDERPAPVTAPDLAYANDSEGLQRLVDAAMGQEFGHPPHHDEDGDIPVFDGDGGSAYISVRGEAAVEIWSILAADVNRARARRAMVRLSTKYPMHKFHLKGRALVASVPLFAHPFVPELLTAAVAGTLYVSSKERERQTRRLQRIHPPKRSCQADGDPDVTLVDRPDDRDAPASGSSRRRKHS